MTATVHLEVRVLIGTIFSAIFSGCVGAQLTAETSIQRFQDTALLSTRYYRVNGAQAVDLYWKASELGSSSNHDRKFQQSLRDLYQDLGGDTVVRATLSHGGWKISRAARQLVLTQGEAFSNFLVLVCNETDDSVEITAAVRAPELSSEGHEELQLEAGESRAFALTLQADRVKRFSADLQLQSGAIKASSPLQVEVRPAVRLRIRVLDPLGRPTPARVYLRASDGFSHTPRDSFDRVMWMTGEHYFYTTGVSEIILPAGAARMEVRKGFDYLPVLRELNLQPRHSSRLDVQLAWLRNMNAEGWYGGDDHIHGNYTGEQWSTPDDDILDVRAEGLNVANMMVSNSVGGAIHDEKFFEGKPNKVSDTQTILYWNQEMRTWSYGHLVLLNLEQLVRPLYLGFPGSEQWEDFPSNYVQALSAQQQGGTVVYAHPALRFDEFPVGSLAAESVADVPLGVIDAFEVFCSHDEPSMELWYKFLNLGFKVGIAGGSDAFLNQNFAFLPGGERMYVYTGREFTYESWMDGFKRGRSFATVGPLLDFRLDGKLPGSEEKFQAGPVTLPVKISVLSTIPVSRAEVIENGQVVAVASPPQPTNDLEWRGGVTISQSAWLSARLWGPNNARIANGPSRWSQRRSPDVALLAHSSPSYVYIGGQPIFSAKDRDFCLRWLDSEMKEIQKNGKFASETQRAEVLRTFTKARQIYLQMDTTNTEAHR